MDKASPSSDDAPRDPVLEALADSAPWRVSRSRDFGNTLHVNLQELREFSDEVRDRALEGSPQRFVNLSDSKVVVHAFAKGRSSSYRLNARLRQLLGHLIFGCVSAGNLWVPSASNPADDPS
eukprot:5334948-Karenia_brevis.AAC.1